MNQGSGTAPVLFRVALVCAAILCAALLLPDMIILLDVRKWPVSVYVIFFISVIVLLLAARFDVDSYRIFVPKLPNEVEYPEASDSLKQLLSICLLAVLGYIVISICPFDWLHLFSGIQNWGLSVWLLLNVLILIALGLWYWLRRV